MDIESPPPEKNQPTTTIATTATTATTLPVATGATPHPANNDNNNKNDEEDNTSSICWNVANFIFYPLRVLLGLMALCIGACLNTVLDCCRDKDARKRREWAETRQVMNEFINQSSLKTEFQDARRGLISNVRIVNAIGRKIYAEGRSSACAIVHPPTLARVQATFTVHEARRFMKYATAAYGPQVVAGTIMGTGEHALPPQPLASIRPTVMKHISVPNDDDNIVVLKLDYGDDASYLRHFCVIDHVHKAVVLAVRGTVSISTTMANCAALSADFCGGQAHAGMAKMARGIWQESGPDIVQRLERLPADYEFVLCGHSLGAGVAGLIHVLVHYETQIPSTRACRCFLYSSPATFSLHSHDTDCAWLDNALAFNHQRDIVPFCSLYALRRYCHLLKAVQKQKIPFWKKALLVHDWMQPSERLLQAYRQANEEALPPLDGAPPLYIPARTFVWMEHQKQQQRQQQRQEQQNNKNSCCQPEVFQATICDPVQLVDVGPVVTPSGLSDHLTSPYEYALHHVQNF